jgi:hypothetical protein
MCLSTPDMPAQQKIPRMVQQQDPAVQAALDADRKRRAGAGPAAMNPTGGAGILTSPATAMKTLLGA